MPSTEFPSLLVNCSNGFVRENQSWILSRLLRDHELKHNLDSRREEEGGRGESIRIDIFNLGLASYPHRDFRVVARLGNHFSSTHYLMRTVNCIRSLGYKWQ